MLKYIVILPVKIYQKTISPLLGARCRFHPTCSAYMIEAVNEWGLFKGTYLGLRRLFSCHPWGPFGLDPVPKKPVSKNKEK